MSKKIKIEAKDVDTAVAQGLKELGLRRDQAEVLILERPSKGFLGIGAKQAVVEIRQKRWQGGNLDSQIYMDVPKKRNGGGRGERRERGERSERGGRSERGERSERGGRPGGKFNKSGRGRNEKNNFKKEQSSEPKTPKANEPQLLPSQEIQNRVIPENLKAPMQEAKDMLSKMLEHMDVKVENLNAWWDGTQQRILLTFDCDHPAIVIGKEGKTLEAAQYLLTLSLSRHFSTPISVMADTQNYWRKAEDKLNEEIDRGVSTVKRGLKVFRMRPMSAQMRRYVHRALENNPLVETASEGEGKWRKVVIKERETPVGEKQQPAADKAADKAAESPAKCAVPQLDAETARAEVKLDEIIAEENRKKKEAAASEDSCVSGGSSCDVTVKEEAAAFNPSDSSDKECALEQKAAEEIK